MVWLDCTQCEEPFYKCTSALCVTIRTTRHAEFEWRCGRRSSSSSNQSRRVDTAAVELDLTHPVLSRLYVVYSIFADASRVCVCEGTVYANMHNNIILRPQIARTLGQRRDCIHDKLLLLANTVNAQQRTCIAYIRMKMSAASCYWSSPALLYGPRHRARIIVNGARNAFICVLDCTTVENISSEIVVSYK